jgi:hypothetical protein
VSRTSANIRTNKCHTSGLLSSQWSSTKLAVFWDVTSCISVDRTNMAEEHTAMSTQYEMEAQAFSDS